MLNLNLLKYYKVTVVSKQKNSKLVIAITVLTNLWLERTNR